MPVGRGLRVTLAAALMMGAAASVRAQSSEPPADPAVRVGPLAVEPVVRLTNVGHDSNVLNLNGNEQGDFTATFSPAFEAWMTVPYARLRGRGQLDYYYFKELSDLRAVDTDTAVRLEFPLNRLTPFVSGTFVNTRHRQTLEIDAIARRRNDAVIVGADVRLTAKISAGAFAQKARLKYDQNSFYLNSDLAQVLNHGSNGEGAHVRYAVTPFTTIAGEFERTRDRFDVAVDRDSDNVTMRAAVELNPLALVSGRASLGYHKSKFVSGAGTFNGTVALADLTYTLMGRTRFTAGFSRQLRYSYLVQQSEYVETALTLVVVHRITDSWNLIGNVSRGLLSYRDATSTSTATGTGPNLPPGTIPDETILSGGGEVSYTTGRTTIGLRIDHSARQTDQSAQSRGYDRLRIGSTLTYGF